MVFHEREVWMDRRIFTAGEDSLKARSKKKEKKEKKKIQRGSRIRAESSETVKLAVWRALLTLC